MTSILTMYGVTPCHAGSGSSFSVIDLPIQRERHTNWPVIHASGMKGAMRAWFDRYSNNIPQEKRQYESLTELIFGSSSSDSDNAFAGSLSISDAKIQAFPMRSSFAPFVWVTSPAVLARLNKDLKLAGKPTADLSALASLAKDKAYWVNGDFEAGKNILLEEVEVVTEEKIEFAAMANIFAKAERLLIVHDEVFGYAVSHCTSVMAHIKIDQATGTSKEGLRYQEELPSDTLLYSVVSWGSSRNIGDQIKADMIKGFVTEQAISTHLQVGGDETLGRGIFELEWL